MKDVFELNGKWTLTDAETGKTYAQAVPGCNYRALQEAGEIPDPFVGLNEKADLWVGERDWIYEKQFELSPSFLNFNKIYLAFDRLDTLAEITLNGRVVAKTSNAHVGYEFEVKEFLAEKNLLRVKFSSPINYVLERQKSLKCPVNGNGLTGIAALRKPSCHFGWDWGPVIPVSGITGEARLVGSSGGRISEFDVFQHHGEKVTVEVRAAAEKPLVAGLELVAELISPSGDKQRKSAAQSGENTFVFEVENPMLWQPNGATKRTEQPLYTVNLKLLSGDTVVDEKEKKIGLRTVELDLSPDEYGENFAFKVNGKRVFCKGASVIPFDSYPSRVTAADVERYVKIAAECGFNMLRVWGGGEYGSEIFYDLCDRYGILVWQDFMFACQGYPFFDEEFSKSVSEEIEYQVKRLSHRASLAIFCGNNEIEVMSMAWIYKRKYISSAKNFFYETLPALIKKHNDFTPYVPGSPLGAGYMKKNGSEDVGDTHLWAVWHGFQPIKFYRKNYTRFCSEFGFESMPDERTVVGFLGKGNLPSLSDEAFSAHQKCKNGNEKMKFYITENYRLPKSFEDYVYLSEVCQAACVADATEHWRRNAGRCNGALYWQFNDCWPTCSWAGIDYHKRYKALQYQAKKFMNPFTVSIEDGDKKFRVFALNDRIEPQEGVLTVRIVRFDGEVVFEEKTAFSVLGSDKKVVWEGELKKFGGRKALKNAVFAATLSAYGKSETKTVLFDKERNVPLPAANIDVDVKVRGTTAEYCLESDKFVRCLRLKTAYDSPLSDNFFDLLPGKKVTVTGVVPEGVDSKDVKKGLSLMHVGLMKPCGSRLSEKLFRLKTLADPWNLLNYVWYKFFM